MSGVFTFYKAVDPIKGSWDGYGYFPIEENDFLAFVADAPSGASIHTPEMMKQFCQEFATQNHSSEFPQIELADALNRLQRQLDQKGRSENILHQATIVIVRKIKTKLLYCCIGDSALQILRTGKLFRLSENEIWDGTLISQESSQSRERQKTADLRFLGSNGSFVHTSEIRTLEIKNGDVLLLSTDGVEDLISPVQLLPLVSSDPEKLRSGMERIFAPERIKDDATLLMVPVHVPSAFVAQKELGEMRRLLEQIQKDQNALRKQIQDVSPSVGRISKLESSIRQISEDVQKSKKSVSIQAPVTKSWPSLPWLIGLLCLLVGTAAGAFFMRGTRTTKDTQPAPNMESKVESEAARTTAIAPPEIPAEQKCTYIVQKGDTLDKIAAAQKISVSELLKLNPQQKRAISLKVGQKISLCQEETP